MINAYDLTEELVDALYGIGSLDADFLKESRDAIFRVCSMHLNEPEEDGVIVTDYGAEYPAGTTDEELLNFHSQTGIA